MGKGEMIEKYWSVDAAFITFEAARWSYNGHLDIGS